MPQENIDYDGLKKRGFLRQKQAGFFVLRTRMTAGVYTKEQLDKFAEVSQKYAKGFVHATTRQGLEIPFVKYEDIPAVEREIAAVHILTGTSGPRVRTTTVCPGNNWCKQGLIDTFALDQRLEKELGIRCAMDVPHKFKIAIAGCPNTCTRVEGSDIGIHGQVDTSDPAKRVGFVVYVGGCGGRTPRLGIKLDRIFASEEEVLSLVEKVVAFYKNRAKPKQRLALLIEEIGKEEFLRQIKK